MISLQDLVTFLGELHGKGVDLYLHQQGIDTTTPAGKMMFQMMGVFAEFERTMIQERIHAGLGRARAKGKALGRPKTLTPQASRSDMHPTGRWNEFQEDRPANQTVAWRCTAGIRCRIGDGHGNG